MQNLEYLAALSFRLLSRKMPDVTPITSNLHRGRPFCCSACVCCFLSVNLEQ